eukprot:6187868-Pleurochrysis_carterae.AAC.4
MASKYIQRRVETRTLFNRGLACARYVPQPLAPKSPPPSPLAFLATAPAPCLAAAPCAARPHAPPSP